VVRSIRWRCAYRRWFVRRLASGPVLRGRLSHRRDSRRSSHRFHFADCFHHGRKSHSRRCHLGQPADFVVVRESALHRIRHFRAACPRGLHRLRSLCGQSSCEDFTLMTMQPNYSQQRTEVGRRHFNRRVSWAAVAELGLLDRSPDRARRTQRRYSPSTRAVGSFQRRIYGLPSSQRRTPHRK